MCGPQAAPSAGGVIGGRVTLEEKIIGTALDI